MNKSGRKPASKSKPPRPGKRARRAAPVTSPASAPALRRRVADLEKRCRTMAQAFADAQARTRLCEQAMAASGGGLAMADLRGRVTYANPAFLRMWGYHGQQEVLGRPTQDFTATAGHQKEMIQRVMAGQTWAGEVVGLRKDGSCFDVHLTVSLLRDAAGQPLAIVGSHHDMSDRKRTERALYEAQWMLRLVLDTVPARVLWKDRQGRYLGANRAVVEDLGLAAVGELIGKTDHDLAWAKHADRYRRDDLEVVRAGRPKLNYEEPYVGADGRELWIRTSKVPLCDAGGQVMGVLVVYEDITDAKKLEERSRQQMAELEHASRLTTAGQMAAAMAHEINQPLTAVANLIELSTRSLRKKPQVTARELGNLKSAVEQVMLAGQIIRQTMAFARRSEPNDAVVDANKVVHEAAALMRVDARYHEVALDLELGPGPLAVYIDRVELQQVLANLIRNAVDAIEHAQPPARRVLIQTRAEPPERPEPSESPQTPEPPGPPKPPGTPEYPAVTRSPVAAGPAGRVVVQVGDTGGGVEAAAQARLFEAFHSNKREGLGLGLWVCRNILESHGGGIRLASTGPQGTRFEFWLPVAQAVGGGG